MKLFQEFIDVNVTQKHIDSGIKDDCNSCPVALAISEQFPGVTVKVFDDEILIGSATYRCTSELQEWILFFDYPEEGEQIRPIQARVYLA